MYTIYYAFHFLRLSKTLLVANNVFQESRTFCTWNKLLVRKKSVLAALEKVRVHLAIVDDRPCSQMSQSTWAVTCMAKIAVAYLGTVSYL